MISMILKMFGGNQAMAIGAAILLAVVGGYIGLLKWDIHSLKADKAKLKVQVVELKLDVEREKANTRECIGKIESTNNHINDLKEANTNRTEIIGMLEDNIKAVKEVTEIRVNEIEAIATPINCEETMALLRGGITQ